MDNGNEKEVLNQEQPAQEEEYVPRPKWQIWGARFALVIFLILVALQLLQMAGGGL